MALRDIKEKLYRKDAQERKREKTIYNPQVARSPESELGKESPWQAQERDGIGRKLRTPLMMVVVIFSTIALLLFAVWTVMTIRAGLFKERNVHLSVEGPVVVSNGMSATYTIRYINDNEVTLTDAKITFEHTPAFKIDEGNGFTYDAVNRSTYSVGEIKPNEEREIVVRGHFDDVEPAGVMYIEAQLSFMPATKKKRFSVKNRLGLTQDADNMQLVITAQKEVANNDIIEYTIRYTNDSQKSYDGVSVVARFPNGFVMQDARPTPTEKDAVWHIGTVAPHTDGLITVRGTLSGVEEEVKTAVFAINAKKDGRNVAIVREEWATRIAPLPLTIKQYVNNKTSYNAHVGEELIYKLRYENTSDVGMRDVVVRLKFDDRILNYRKLNLSSSGGSLEPATRSIVWRASDFPELAVVEPGKSGDILFSIPVRDDIVVKDDNDRHLTISTTAEIDSPDVPTPIGENKIISSNTMVLKLNSKVTFKTEGFYDDFVIKNTGPVPPVRRIKTTYTIRWSLTNSTNELSNAKVEAFLPTSATWEGVVFPETETVQFNPRTHKIVWNIGDVKNGVGYFRKKREVRFQVSVTPTVNQVGQVAPLLKKSIFTAKDVFTGEPVRIITPPKTTFLNEDPMTGNGVVKE